MNVEKRTKPDENNLGIITLENNKKNYSRNSIPSSVEYLK